MYKLAFFGTPQFALRGLESLHENSDFKIMKVITSPDRPAGRKLKLTPSPIKVWALDHGLDVWTPSSCKDLKFIQDFKSLNVDGTVVIAFGQILPQPLLDLCPQKFVNVHASLLPRWRGAAPIQRALIHGDLKTGVCLQTMVLKLDAGDIVSQAETEISNTDTAIDLHDRLSEMGADLLDKTLKSYLDGQTSPSLQKDSQVTYAPKIQNQESVIDWSLSASQIWNLIRGLALGSGGVSFLNSKRLRFLKCQPLKDVYSLKDNPDLKDVQQSKYPQHSQDPPSLDSSSSQISPELIPGTIQAIYSDSFDVVCGQGTYLRVFSLKPESKSQMSAQAFLNGYKISVGLKLESQ